MKDKILLPNRYGFKNYLVKDKEDDKKYTIECDESMTFNVAYEDNECTKIKFIDPSGGFPMGSGTIIEGKVIKEITWNDKLYIIFE